MIKINNIDFTDCVQESTYKIDEQPVYTEWKDANGRAHRQVTRQRVSGSFELVFVEGYKKSYPQFLEALRAATEDGVLTITVTVNNINEDKAIECFYKITFDAPQLISSGRVFRKCTFNVEEC